LVFVVPLVFYVSALFKAALVLGIVWAVRHLPAFMLSSTPQSAKIILFFVVFGCIHTKYKEAYDESDNRSDG
jgi:hypothetical protein